MAGLRQQNSATIPAVLVILYFYMLPFLVEYFASVQETVDRLESRLKPEYLLNKEEVFDYIIVGGGTAGCVVANRLSSNPRNKVLLLEAGGDPNPYEDILSLYSAIDQFESKRLLFSYDTEPEPNTCLDNAGKCRIVTGKGLGGSSGVNAVIYQRGSSKDFDEWAKITGDQSWAYTNVLQAFKKLEDYHGFFDPPGNAHAKGGPLYVDQEPNSEFRQILYRAAQEKGLNFYDFNTQFVKGYGQFDFNYKNGRRWQTYKAFLKPALRRKNLKVYRYAAAIKVHLVEITGNVYGVTYKRHGVSRFVRAKKEIIVSAGPIESPKLLLLSGIGPREHLESVGVRPLINLPVGIGLQDHAASKSLPLSYSVNKRITLDPKRDLTFEDVASFLASGKGPLGVLDFNPGAVIYTNSSQSKSDWPDIELSVRPKYPPTNVTWDRDRFNIDVILLRPKGFGKVQLRSRNPDELAAVQAGYLSVPFDMSRLIDGIVFMVNLIETSRTFQTLDVRIEPSAQIPGCETKVFKSRDYWECHLRHQNLAYRHLFGSCRMGKSGDSRAVVDSKLRVFKTIGLRVVDNSVIPGFASGHTCAAASMIGEMGSTFILEHQKRKRNGNNIAQISFQSFKGQVH